MRKRPPARIGPAPMPALPAAHCEFPPRVADLERGHPAVRDAIAAMPAPPLRALQMAATAGPGSGGSAAAHCAAAALPAAGMRDAVPAQAHRGGMPKPGNDAQRPRGIGRLRPAAGGRRLLHATRLAPGRSFYRGRGPCAGMDATQGMLAACGPLHRLVVLLAASNGGEPIRGRTKLQKIVFMLTEGEEQEYGPCGYDAGSDGPHSGIVDEAAGRLEDAGILRADGRDISVTQLGREVAGRIAGEEDGRTLAMIGRYKEMFNDLAADELLAYVYSAYPGTAAGSPAYGRIAPNMELHVMSMLKKEKITSERASELLGRPLEDVLRLAGRMRIRTLR